MKQTTNFHLNKPDTTDYYNIQDSNNNMDIIDAEIKEAQDKADQAFQSASNGKAAIKTAITGVDPTVTIPTDATFNQLAASIGQIKTGIDTEDATATAGDIVAPKTAYVKGVKVTGNIPTKTAAIYTPGTSDQTITAKQYLDGAQTIKGDANLIPANILAGKTVFNVAGTASTEKYDFPLSIQSIQPTAVAVGHIWVSSSTLASNITTVKVIEAVSAGAANGTLMLVVGSLTGEYQSISQNKILRSGTSVTFTVDSPGSDSSTWTVNLSGGTIKFPKPLVYSKIGGVLDIETAYMWNGSSWILLSQKGHYVVSFTNSALQVNSYIYNDINGNVTLNTSSTVYSNHSLGRSLYTNDGTYIIAGYNVYKRVGDVFSLYFTIPSSDSSTGITASVSSSNYVHAAISKNGLILTVAFFYSTGSNMYVYFVVFSNTGSTFTKKYATPVYNYGATSILIGDIIINYDGTLICFNVNTGTINYSNIGYFLGDTSASAAINTGAGQITYYALATTGYSMRFSYDNAYLIVSHSEYNSSSQLIPKIAKIPINYVSKSFGTLVNLCTGNYAYPFKLCGIHPISGHILFTVEGGSPANMLKVTPLATGGGPIDSAAIPTCPYNLEFSPDGTYAIGSSKMVTTNDTEDIYYYSVSYSGNTYTFTKVNTSEIAALKTYRGGLGLIPAL